MNKNKVLCVGHTNWDVVIHTEKVPDPDYSSAIDGQHNSCGGSATNTALALSSFDKDVSMLGSIGNDEYGSLVEETLEDVGVTPYLNISEDVGTTLIYAIITDDADPRYFAKAEELDGINLERIPGSLWDEIGHVHLTSFSEKAGEIAEEASEDGKSVSFNPSQGYMDQEFPHVVENADVIFVNDREAEMFKNRYDFNEQVGDKVIVVTHGGAGSTMYKKNGEQVNHPGFSYGEVKDTIGAGDSFIAGFLSEWLDCKDCDKALDVANATGAYSVTRVGAPDVLDTDEIERIYTNN